MTIDVGALNGPAMRRFVPNAAPFPLIIVPGYTPRFGWQVGLHPKNRARLAIALCDLRLGVAPTILVSGGAVHSPDNEAILMREWLLENGVAEDQIIVEPWSRHTTSNLRNAGAMMLAQGASEAMIVTSDRENVRPTKHGWRVFEQAFYVGTPWLSGFHLSCLAELGHTVGELTWLAPHRIRFRPSPRCLSTVSRARPQSLRARWLLARGVVGV